MCAMAFIFVLSACKKDETMCSNPPIVYPPPAVPAFTLTKTSLPDTWITAPGTYLIMQFIAKASNIPKCIVSDGTLRLKSNGNLAEVKDVTVVMSNQGGVLFKQTLSDSAVSAVGFRPELAITDQSLDTISIWATFPNVATTVETSRTISGTLEIGFVWQGSPRTPLSSGLGGTPGQITKY